MTDPLIVDAFYGDGIKPTDWKTLALAGMPWAGAIIQACHGTDVSGWFVDSWDSVRTAGGPRYGIDWFRGAYAYFVVTDERNAVEQADAFLSAVDAAGGWDDGDLWPMIDVERADQNPNVTKDQVVNCGNAWSDRILHAGGRRPGLYGGSFLRSLNITDHLGCQLLWFPRWTSTLPESSYNAIGWSRDRLWGWQYCGDGTASLAGYPSVTPIGKHDITAIVIGDAGGASVPLEFTRTRRGVEPGKP